jgi:hypothetical protein
MNDYTELQPAGEYTKQVVREAGIALWAIVENACVLALCVCSPLVYLGAMAYLAWKSRK